MSDTTWWLQYVPHSRVKTYEMVGWTVESAAPSHHDTFKVLMRHEGEAEPPVPVGRARATRAGPQPRRQG